MPGIRGVADRLPRRIGGVRLLFVVGVILPTLLATLYYGLVASRRYVSEAEFVVRGVNHRKATGLEMFFQTFGLSRAVDDANVIQSYMQSRDALRALDGRLPLRQWFGGADLLSRFPRPWTSDSEESLYDYYRDRVTVIQNASKGITSLSVQGFAPDQAQAIALQLLALAEDVVNRMNDRAQTDAVHYATGELDTARTRLIDAQRALTEFRTREAMVDPTSNSTSVLDTITTLQTDLARAMTEAAESTSTTGASPSLPALQGKVTALKQRIAEERAKIAGDAGALAPRVAAYEGLTLARQLAEKGLASADLALDSARQDARHQQIYIEHVVSPQKPDEDTEPQRLRMILTVLVLSFALTSVVWILTAGASEHAID